MQEQNFQTPGSPATPWVIDFALDDLTIQRVGSQEAKAYKTTQRTAIKRVVPVRDHSQPNGVRYEGAGNPVRSMTPKQIRARARRRGKILEADLEALYKPIDEWDAEELARGMPRAKHGGFHGIKPAYISRAVHEKIVKRFEEVVRMDMREHTVEALVVLRKILEDDTVDRRGRPTIPASTKLEAAKFLIEHVVGKPTKRVESDISIKLQAILGTAMLNPSTNPSDPTPQLTQGYIDAHVIDEPDDGE